MSALYPPVNSVFSLQARARRNSGLTSRPRAIQLLLGHSKIDGTVFYSGHDLEDALSGAERIDI